MTAVPRLEAERVEWRVTPGPVVQPLSNWFGLAQPLSCEWLASGDYGRD
jgi:hypothetical protein